MVAAAFPVAKLFILLLRQISKPLVEKLKVRAKKSHFFRTYIVMPPAQLYHWMDIKTQMLRFNLGKPTQVQKLNENMAVEQGAEILGDVIILSIPGAYAIYEHNRSSKKERDKEAAKDLRFQELEDLVIDLKYQLLEITKHLATASIQETPKLQNVAPKSESDSAKNFLEKALVDATKITLRGTNLHYS